MTLIPYLAGLRLALPAVVSCSHVFSNIYIYISEAYNTVYLIALLSASPLLIQHGVLRYAQINLSAKDW